MDRRLFVMVSLATLSSWTAALAANEGKAEEIPQVNGTKSLTVAVVSSHSKFCDPRANLKHFESLIRDAVAKGARLVCFPELALMSYTTEKEILEVAEPIPGPSTEKLEAIARSLDVYLSVGRRRRRVDTGQDGLFCPEGNCVTSLHSDQQFGGRYGKPAWRKSVRKWGHGH